MPKDTNISIIQLIKSGKISINYEISNLFANKGINIHIRTYLEKCDQYKEIQQHIHQVKANLQNCKNIDEKLFLNQKIQNLCEIEKDFISNTLYLAESLSKIEPRTDILKKVIDLFEQAKIKDADAILSESDLINDQFYLIAFAEYQEKKLKFIRDEFINLFN